MKLSRLRYALEDGYPILELEINGHPVSLAGDSLNSIGYGYVLIDGVGLSETIIRLPGVELEGEYTNDPLLLRVCRQFLDDINSRAVPFESILGARPIPRV
jgi:hypothetical protein